MKILDACCGGKMFWYEKDLDFVDFQDNRELQTELCDGRKFSVKPDFIGDVTKMDMPDEEYDIVVFDPPHMIRAGKTSWLNIKYGKLPENWETFFKNAFSEIFRVLKENGVLIFKWNETQLKFGEVIKHSPYRPMLGDQRGQTRWTVFVKNTALHHHKEEIYC